MGSNVLVTDVSGDRAPRTPAVLDLAVLRDPDGLVAALLDVGTWGTGEGDLWLRDRYSEIAPRIIPAVLDCLRTGERLPDETREVVATSARTCREHTVSYATVLRGGIPALGAFARFLRQGDTTPGPRELTLVMSRAAVLAQELGACWAESWRPVTTPVVDTGGCGLAVEASPGTLESPALEMVTLAAAGWSNDQIARETSYSPQAVKWHLARTMRAWGVGNRAALVAVAFVRGVLRGRTR